MLVLGRYLGEWIQVIHHKSGDMLYIQVVDTRTECCTLGFEDDDRNFRIERAGRIVQSKHKETIDNGS